MPGISSERVTLIERVADKIVPNAKLEADMHGFVIMVPPGEEGERLLDMLWRITMAYAGKPSLLTSRTAVRKMVEAVWSKESREVIARPAPKPKAKLRSAVAKAESLRDPGSRRKAKTRGKS
jgi:hypothetical protein